MLSMVKAALVFKYPDYFLVSEHLDHGLTIGPRVRRQFDFNTDHIALKQRGIYQLARRALAFPPLPAGLQITLNDVMTRLPDVDEGYRLLFRLRNERSNCLRFIES